MDESEATTLAISNNLILWLYLCPSNKRVPKQQSVKAEVIPKTLFLLVPITELPPLEKP